MSLIEVERTVDGRKGVDNQEKRDAIEAPVFFIALHVFRQYNCWGPLLSESDCLMSEVDPILKEFMAV